jgi:hypothetical protein
MPISSRAFPMFSSNSFKVSGITCRSLIFIHVTSVILIKLAVPTQDTKSELLSIVHKAL